MSKRNRPITIWRKTKGGGRVGRKGFVSNRTGRLRQSSRFTASFETDQDFDLYLDSRHLQKKIGDTLKQYYVRSIKADENPETGQANPATYKTEKGRWRERNGSKAHRNYMASNLRRTIVSTNSSWGGGGKRISYSRTRMKFYFQDLPARGINKFESTRKHNRAYYLGVGGRVRPLIDRKLGEWMDLVMDGHKFQWPPDSKSDAWG